ncbi:hypothetical protein [Streptomyces sp. Ncost-T10-10d]|uniref:hypothetical protein n=1 Tax=Streptomyces sp. Ncost-T10-10d TaxID=1839774 RepID=UPI00081DDEFA|nr:hypothetical protein [Streptomyces sp. Ncost-T10-10d]SCF97305.1 hypothetical protein GA0115254_1284109 [Streptomyces sp. Ncost-T10-10d]
MTSETNTLGTIDATTALLQAELPRLEQHQQTLEKELATVTERLESVRTALTALRSLSTSPVPSSNTEAQDVKAADATAEAEGVKAEAETESVAAPRIPQQAQGSIDSAVPAEVPQEPAAAAPARRTARKTSAPKGRKQAPAKPKTERGQAKKAVATKSAKPAKAAAPAKATAPAKAAKPAKTAKSAASKKAAPAAPVVDDSGSLTEMAMKVLSTFGDTPVRAREVTKALGRELTPNSINTVRSTLDRLVGTSRAHRAGRGLYQAPAN